MSQKIIKEMTSLLKQLPDDDLEHLLAFTRYLHSCVPIDTGIVEPSVIERPDKESVVGAIKRLSNTYPMLNKSKMLDQTSMLMTQHLTLGRNIVEVVDDLENVFSQHYADYQQEKQDLSSS